MPHDATAIGLAVAAIAVVVATAAVPVPVSAHVDDVGVDNQISADGTVVVETVFVGTDGFVVLHWVNGSDPGEPIGHAAVSEEGGLKEDVTVAVADGTWRNWSGDRRVWAVLHADDGDGEFEPGEDETIEQFGDPAGDRFTLERGDAPAYVTAREFAPQPSDDATVTVRAAALPVDGHVVLRTDAEDGPGEVVGSTAAAAGTSRNVTVAMDEDFFRDRNGTFALYAMLYADDGDGAFDGSDDPVTAGADPVATRFGVEKTGGPTPTPTAEGDTHDGGDGNAGHGHGHEHTHRSETTAGSDADTEGAGEVVGDGPGFGPLAALAALTAVAVLATIARRRP